MKPWLIDWRDWLRGESSSDDASDKGFSQRSYGLNLTKARGLLYFSESSTDRGGATLTGNPIGSTYDKTLSGNDGYIMDDEGAFYTIAGATLTKRQTMTGTWALGTAEILQYSPAVSTSYTFATSDSAIIRFTGSDLTSAAPDTDFWTGLSTGVRHPIEKVENLVCFGDGNLIHVYDGTTTTSAYVTLPPDVNITSLRKHPNGQNLVAFCGLGQNYSHTRSTPGRIYIVDLNIKKWIREIDIGSQVEGSRLVGGIIYTTYGQNVGYFDGNGIKFLKRLSYSTTTYSHNMGDWEGNLIIRDGIFLLTFGDLGMGRVWWRPTSNDVNANNINNILYKGSDTVLMGFSDSAGAGKLIEVNLANAGSSGVFQSNKTNFELTSSLRRLEILHTALTASTFRISFSNVDENDSLNAVYDSNPSVASANWAKHRVETDIKVDSARLLLQQSNATPGYRFIRVMYEAIER